MTKLYSRLVGSHRREADEILKVKHKILTGRLVAIDPGSNSLGFSLWDNGVLMRSGSIKSKGPVGSRLADLRAQLSCEILGGFTAPDVMLLEKVRTGTGHVYLTWAAGVAAAAVCSDTVLEVSTMAWKKNTTSAYVKGDEQDAVEIGKFAVTLCKEAMKPRRGRDKHSKPRKRRRNAA